MQASILWSGKYGWVTSLTIVGRQLFSISSSYMDFLFLTL
jgi:hypothetical protein